MTSVTHRILDTQGRLNLGSKNAGRLMIVKEIDESTMEITFAEAVPEKEVWLHKNKAAKASVIKGLEQTGRGEYVEGPDLDADAKALDELGA